MDIARELGSRIKNAREATKLTQAQLAEASGLSINFVGLVERGKAIPSIRSLSRIADILGVSLAELFQLPGKEASLSEKLLSELTWLLRNRPPEDIQFVIDIARRTMERLP